MERIVSNFTFSFWKENNILSPFQHGFRKGFSSTAQLLSPVHDFAASLDKFGQVDVVFVDFSKAFDRVPHKKLVFKLKNC